MRRFQILLVLVVACGGGGNSGDDTVPIDAPKTTHDAPSTSGKTSCGDPVATTAPASLTITGQLNDGSASQEPVGDATVTAFGGGVSRGTTQSETGGLYQIAVTTGGVPIDYVTFTKAGLKSARYYPRTPIARSVSIANLALFTTADAATYISMFGVSGSGAVAVISIVDCEDSTPVGATMDASSGTVKYLHSDDSTDGTSVDDTGIAVALNMSTGSGTIDATDGADTYQTLAITADPSYITYGVISPK